MKNIIIWSRKQNTQRKCGGINK